MARTSSWLGIVALAPGLVSVCMLAWLVFDLEPPQRQVGSALPHYDQPAVIDHYRLVARLHLFGATTALAGVVAAFPRRRSRAGLGGLIVSAVALILWSFFLNALVGLCSTGVLDGYCRP